MKQKAAHCTNLGSPCPRLGKEPAKKDENSDCPSPIRPPTPRLCDSHVHHESLVFVRGRETIFSDKVNSCRNISITLIFRLLPDGPDLIRTESNRNLSEIA